MPRIETSYGKHCQMISVWNFAANAANWNCVPDVEHPALELMGRTKPAYGLPLWKTKPLWYTQPMPNSEIIEAIIALAPNLASRESLEKMPHDALSEMLGDIQAANAACRAGRRLADVFDQDISISMISPRSAK